MKKTIIAIALFTFVMTGFLSIPALALDKTSKYRVYQNDNMLMEFYDYKSAEDYARGFARSRVENISTQEWLWNNFPRYRLYQYDKTFPNWEFANLEDAKREASRWSFASIRDLQSGGWVWNNYPSFRVYQGELTLPEWEFQSLNDAIAEARKWARSNIIDTRSNTWVWDNLTTDNKTQLRNGNKIYRIYQGNYTNDNWTFGYLEDAIKEATYWSNTIIVNTSTSASTNKTVFSNLKKYQVFQNENLLDGFVNLDTAIRYAQLWSNATIRLDGRIIWSNLPMYVVYQNDNKIAEFNTIPSALNYATYYANASIRDRDTNKNIWTNKRRLIYLGWNGMSSLDAISAQVAQTQGMDIDSPTWFHLADASGNLTDLSTQSTTDYLKKLGFAVHPLVTNQFDPALTTAFLSNPKAQDAFIDSLIKRCVQLGVQGINIDFENLSGKDRAPFTAFVKKLSDKAHASKLIVSIDLPRGSIRWNHLTAFDHEALGSIVDYVMIMAYDQFFSGSTTPGSVAGLPWVEEGIQEFLSYGIPRDKIMLGVPFYIREWTLDANNNLIGNRAIYTKSVNELLSGRSAKTSWDTTFDQYRIEFQDGDNKRVFWLENADTLKARIDLAKKYQLAGLAMWRLGHEPENFWTTLIQNK